MIQTFDVYLVSESVATFVTGTKLLIKICRHRIIAIEIHVAPHTKMLRSNQLSHMIKVIKYVLDSCRLITFDKHSYAGDPNYTSSLTNFLDCLIRFKTWMIRHQSATIRVS